MSLGRLFSVLEDQVIIPYGGSSLAVPPRATIPNVESALITTIPPGLRFISDDGTIVIPPGSGVPSSPESDLFADAIALSYTPELPADWPDPDPGTVQEALDSLAAQVAGGGSGGSSVLEVQIFS